jgi:inosine-uridine nucleoside N-ribohydrolase
MHQLLAEALPVYQGFHEKVAGVSGIQVHDPTAVTRLIHPEFFHHDSGPIRVETQGVSRGKTWVANDRHLTFASASEWKNRPSINVCWGVNGSAVTDFLTECLAG